MKIKRGDNVIVTLGKDKGKTGKVEKVFTSEAKVAVAGINMYKKHLKSRKGVAQAGIVDIIKPLAISNVALVCPKCNLPTRVSFEVKGKEKLRICKKCKQSF
ncbi:MAG: 50S ribosomal protein L24 [bacterium]|nr:50S ribosomal protein L24 [bacterium]